MSLTRAGDWFLEGAIASGGFGDVYRARREDGRRAAVKVLHAELASQPEAAARLLREVEAVRRVDHPAVIRIYETGQVGGVPWYAMELLEGEDLAQRLAHRGRLPVPEALAILAPVCEALARAHEAGVIHRDVKASNVFLPEDGRVILLDFGVAKLLDDDATALTLSRQVVGTPSCMAPEQIAGRPATARTDVYALAALTFHLLTGEACFGDETPTMLSWLHLHARRPRPSRRAPLPVAVDDVIVRAMSIDPAGRQAGPLELFEELRRALGGSGTAGPPAGETERGVALFLEVGADPDLLASPDEALVADLEAVLSRAAERVAPFGLRPVFETGTSVLHLRSLGPGEGEPELLATAEEAATVLRKALEGRPGADPRLRVVIRVSSGLVADLLRLDWV